MKHQLFLVSIFVLSFLSACTGNTPSLKLPTEPEALIAYDNSSGGIVKGILVGSTGNFKFNLKNGSDSVYCKITFDGQTGMLLPTTSMASWTPGQAFAATFTGIVGGVTVNVYFKCNADGTSPSATFTIPNHTIVVSIYKETSTVLVKGYEGTYTTYTVSSGAVYDKGTFNFIECNGKVYGTHSSITFASDPRYTGPAAFSATVSNGKLIVDGDTKSFDITETSLSGSSLSTDGTERTTISGTRTL